VGVVVLDKAGRVASTVSSGGIALKQPGRVGQASVFGCGCWAQQGNFKSSPSFTVGVSTTGCGEHLVRTFLARECAQHLTVSRLPLNALQTVMKEKFAESDFLAGVPEKLGGAICMHYDEVHGRGQFLWTHTTASMGIAYQTTSDEAATTVMSRIKEHPPPNSSGTCILVEAVPFVTKMPQNVNNGCNNAAVEAVASMQSARA
jgi:taspase (threonine aspartase 1)